MFHVLGMLLWRPGPIFDMVRDASGDTRRTVPCTACERRGIAVLGEVCSLLGEDGAGYAELEKDFERGEITLQALVKKVFGLVYAASDENRRMEAVKVIKDFMESG